MRQIDKVEYECLGCRGVFLTQLRRIKPEGNYCSPCKTRQLNAKRKIDGGYTFRAGMSWDNYGEWQVDHRKPVSVFVKEGILEVAIINDLNNLQPLWKSENLSKGSKYTVST